MSILSGWREQYDRMQRGLTLLRSVAEGEVYASSDEARDALFHFYQDAYHLKDWVKNDDSVKTADDVERFINGTPDLQLCADLCNGTKHLSLNRSHTGDLSTTFGTQGATVRPAPVGSGRPAAPHLHAWSVTSGGTEHDALELASRIVETWTAWLAQQNLL